MELEEIQAVLEKIWDLHDKLSDVIHSISRAHFLNSIKSLRKSHDFFVHRTSEKKTHLVDSDDNHQTGCVFVKDFRVDEDDSVIQEAKSLNAIRNALENLEDQLEIFHTVLTQQRSERDAAVARLEQSRMFLAMRLSEHQGSKYKVIEEARAFVGELCPSGENFVPHEEGGRSNILLKVFISSFNFAKKSLKLEHMGGILGNAALVAVSMLALLHLHQVSCKDTHALDLPQTEEDIVLNRNLTKVYRPKGSSSNGRSTLLDVLLARG